MVRGWLRQYRGDRTHETVAIDADISRVLYTQIENGVRNPSVKTAKKIATALGFSWTLFFDEKCNETVHNKAAI